MHVKVTLRCFALVSAYGSTGLWYAPDICTSMCCLNKYQYMSIGYRAPFSLHISFVNVLGCIWQHGLTGHSTESSDLQHRHQRVWEGVRVAAKPCLARGSQGWELASTWGLVISFLLTQGWSELISLENHWEIWDEATPFPNESGAQRAPNRQMKSWCLWIQL